MIRTTKTVYRAFVEPDFDDLAGAKRKRTPGIAWRALSLACTPAGAILASRVGLSWRVGLFAGGALAIVIRLLAAYRQARRGTR